MYKLNGTIDLAGKVVESADSRLKEGDSFVAVGCGLSEVRDGGYSVYACLPGKFETPMPSGLTEYQVMKFGTVGFTVAIAVIRMKDNGQIPSRSPSSLLVFRVALAVSQSVCYLIRAIDLVHSVCATQSRPRRAAQRLWNFSCSTASRHVKRLMTSTEILGPQASAKGLRHGFGVAAIEAGVPLPTIAAVLGHANIETTAIYTTAIGMEAREQLARMWR